MCTRKQILDSRPRSEWERLINEWIYNELDRYIIKRKLLDGLTFEKLTEEINKDEYRLEVLQVKRRLYRASDRLFRHAQKIQD